MAYKLRSVFVCLMIGASALVAGTTGKITGHITDSGTGEPMVGINVLLQNTSQGAATDADGFYVILNVSPGRYTLVASAIGYTTNIVQDVRVEIDITTTIDFNLASAVIAGQEVVVRAEVSIIKHDVAASQKSISSDRIQSLPVGSLNEVIGLEAGVTSTLQIRGSGSDQSLFLIDGVTMRDERNNSPISQVPLSAVSEVSIQSGGFSAAYNNVRSGVINVVTREGSPSSYGGTISIRYSPPTPKNFGISPYDESAFWLRPFLDPAVAFTGTANGEPWNDANSDGVADAGEYDDLNGDGQHTAWDYYDQRQYAGFEGWNAVAERFLNDEDPDNDLTPSAAQQIFRYQHRIDGVIDQPDYNIDMGFGGPVPLVSKLLGNLRFFASGRAIREAYLIPTNLDALTDVTGMLRVTADLGSSMKLAITSKNSVTNATAASRSGGTAYFTSVGGVASILDRPGHTLSWRLYTDEYYSRTRIQDQMFSAKLTNLISNRSYYEILFRRGTKLYETGPGPDRDTTLYEIVPGIWHDEGPQGFVGPPVHAIGDAMGMGGAISTSRDTSSFITTNLNLSFKSQLSSLHELSTGIKFEMTDFDLVFGSINEFLPEGNFLTKFTRSPIRGNFYIQDKLEAKGFVALIGLVVDRIDPNGDWYDLSGVYDEPFLSSSYTEDYLVEVPLKPAPAATYISPRLGVSHPITANSKLYFNYGHYRQMPFAENLYRVQRANNNSIDRLGNPALELSRTVAYELGYDQVIGTRYVMHLSAYYKDVTAQQSWTQYSNIKGNVDYIQLTNENFEDIRGFEIDLSKRLGDWLTGYANYEYRVGSSGFFGIRRYNENPAEQRKDLRENPPVESRPLPRPRFKSNIEFHSPSNFGPAILGQSILGGWNANLTAFWTQGSWFTWNPGNVRGFGNNVRWKASKAANLRASKSFSFGGMRATFIADFQNVFNLKNFSGEAFYDRDDYYDYMYSLHLPDSDELVANIPGSDRPGTVRGDDVDFVPIEWMANIESAPGIATDRERFFYDASTGDFYSYSSDGGYVSADGARLQEVLDTKAYINMPNQSYLTFLNPRQVFLGINLSFDL